MAMIDWDRVRELQGEVGQEDFDEIVTLFMEEVDGAIAELPGHAGGPGLAEALHFLKGSALNLGFEALASMCASGEVKARGGLHDAVCVTEIEQVYTASRETFLAGVADAA